MNQKFDDPNWERDFNSLIRDDSAFLNKEIPEKESADLYPRENDSSYIELNKGQDNITDFGKGISFYTCDGKEVATIEEVMRYNEMYYKLMMNKTEDTNLHR